MQPDKTASGLGRSFLDFHAPHVSIDTVDRILREANMREWVAKKRAKLIPEHAKKRLEWALVRRHWEVADFEEIVYSDECSIEKSRDLKQKWVFRSPQEKWLPECVQPVGKGKGVSLMVWGCFWGRNRGTFVPLIVKSVDRWVYIRLLETCVIPVLERVRDTIGSPVFQQDNCSVHTATAVMEWFDSNSIDLEDHPPCSPDLNPIEHVWVELKDRKSVV